MTANYGRAFSDRPEVYAAWVELNTSIKAGMDLRRHELVTLVAARRLRSSYCCLAHGKVLLERFDEPVRDIALDHRSAAATARCFFSKTLDSLTVRPDAQFNELDEDVREALVVGRHIAEA